MKNQNKQAGIHITGDFYNCKCNTEFLTNLDQIEKHSIQSVKNAELNAVGNLFHSFGPGQGVTGMVILAESHMSVHTWPENKYVSVDVFVCNMSENNEDKAKNLFLLLKDFFQPEYIQQKTIQR